MTASPNVYAQRIERAPGGLAKFGLAACLAQCRPPPVRASERWRGAPVAVGFTGSVRRWSSHQPRWRVLPIAATGRRLKAEMAGSGIELVRVETGASTHLQWLAAQVRAGKWSAWMAACSLAQRPSCAGALAGSWRSCAHRRGRAGAVWPERPALPAATVYARRRRLCRRARHKLLVATAARQPWQQRTISFPRWTILPGSSVCAAPTWTTPRVPGPCLGRRPEKPRCSWAPARSARSCRQCCCKTAYWVVDYADARAAPAALPASAVLLLDPKRRDPGPAAKVLARRCTWSSNQSRRLAQKPQRTPLEAAIRQAMEQDSCRHARSMPGLKRRWHVAASD